MYLHKLTTMDRMQLKISFKVEYNWFELRVFSFLDWLP